MALSYSIDELTVRYYVMGANDDGPPTVLDECASAEDAGYVLEGHRALGLWQRLWIAVKN